MNDSVRKDFPMLSRQVHGKPYIYLDNAATSLTPFSVIETLRKFYTEDYATVHRGVYELSQKATAQQDRVREKCRDLLGAPQANEIIFVRGATEAINLVAHSYGRKFLKAGDEVIISELEHHANIVPWQILCDEKKAKLKVIPSNDLGELDLEAYKKLLSKKTKIVAIGHMSNALGTIHDVKTITRLAKEMGAVVLVDGAQSVPHMKVDVSEIGCDFYCFSSHKVYGPTGVGVLWGKYELLEAMDPYQAGGDMIELVTFEKTTYEKPPLKFEAGTPAFAEILGLGAAIDYVHKLGFEKIEAQERELLKLATEKLTSIPGLKIIGTSPNKGAIISFIFDDIHPHDLGTILDQEGIAIRTGHHCAQPVMQRFGIPATSRASFSFYNLPSEVDALTSSIEKALTLLS